MKPLLILIDSTENQSISIRKYDEPQFHNPWHFHKEIELVLVLKGSGTCFIGDHIDHFGPGDLILLGNNLPHMLRNKIEYGEGKKALNAEAIVIHFSDQLFANFFLQIPEMKPVLNLLKNAKRGIKVSAKVTENIAVRIKAMLTQTPFQRFLELLRVLHVISEDKNQMSLSSIHFLENINKSQNKKLDRIYEYVMNNFSKSISLEEISEIAHMNKTAFCKFFKERTAKTFIQFVTEVRIYYAKTLLMEGDRNITEIGYECGFNNISNFNRQFKRLADVSPGVFQKNFREKAQKNNF